MEAKRVVPVTVVVVALNSAASLPAFFAGLHRQTVFPAEIVVVDRGSSDATVSLLNAWSPPASTVFSVIQAAGASISEARNVAIEAAAFDSILVTAAEAIPESTWVQHLWAALQSGAEVAGGQVRAPASTSRELVLSAARGGTPARVTDAAFVPSGINLAFRVSAWDAVGGYPEWLAAGEDAVFATALRAYGTRIDYAAGAVTTWRSSTGFRGFLADAYRSSKACGEAGVCEYHPRPVLTGTHGTGVVAAVLAVHVVAQLTRAVGRLAGRLAARVQRDRVHVRAGDSAPIFADHVRLRWYPFDEETFTAPDGPQVTSISG